MLTGRQVTAHNRNDTPTGGQPPEWLALMEQAAKRPDIYSDLTLVRHMIPVVHRVDASAGTR